MRRTSLLSASASLRVMRAQATCLEITTAARTLNLVAEV
jgi:hypothetical protein